MDTTRILDDYGFRIPEIPPIPYNDGHDTLKRTTLRDYGIRERAFPFSMPNNNEEARKMVEQKEKNKPDYNVCVGQEIEGKTYWTTIGAAWKGNNGIVIKLKAHPIADTIVLFDFKEKEKK